MNTITAAELKRRGMAAIEEGLQQGPVHILKHNRPSAVVLSEAEYRRLTGASTGAPAGLSAVQWLLKTVGSGTSSKAQIDAELAAERDAWNEA